MQEGFNLTVGGTLYLNKLTSIPDGFKPTVGLSLHLSKLKSIPKGFSPTVGGSLYLDSVTTMQEDFNPTVGGSLYLDSLTSIPKGVNPTVGSTLDLSKLTSIPEGFNPIVGHNLSLNNIKTISTGFSPTVGGGVYFGGAVYFGGSFWETHNQYVKPLNGQPIFWQGGKYIMVYGAFSEVLHKRGNIYKVKKLNDTHEFYLVTDEEGRWSHGSTIKEAQEDLLYKISNRCKEDYKGLTHNSVLPFSDAIECYRVITGACSFGVKDFIKEFKI